MQQTTKVVLSKIALLGCSLSISFSGDACFGKYTVLLFIFLSCVFFSFFPPPPPFFWGGWMVGWVSEQFPTPFINPPLPISLLGIGGGGGGGQGPCEDVMLLMVTCQTRHLIPDSNIYSVFIMSKNDGRSGLCPTLEGPPCLSLQFHGFIGSTSLGHQGH